MCFRFQGSVCLLFLCLAVFIASHSQYASGEDPPTQVTQRHDWKDRIEAALDAKGEWNFQDAPLSDVCASVQEKLGVDVAIDMKALEDFGIDPRTPITVSLRGISNRSFLHLMLSDLDLTYSMHLGALWITTYEVAESRLTTKIHPIGDLLVRDTSRGDNTPDYDFLREAIMSSISPDAWDEVGGPGAIEGVYDTLVVLQTSDIHEQVSEFLTAYREIVATDREIGADAQSSRILGLQEASAIIMQALDQPLAIEFKNAQLKDVVHLLSKSAGIPIVIDTRALEDYGIDTSTPFSEKISETPMRFALSRVLNGLELTCLIRDEVLKITTPEESERQLDIGLYPVRELVQIAEAQSIDPVGANSDFDSLIKVITSTIAPDTWDEVGGPGAICPLLPAPTLMIAQTSDVHEEISELLTQLRAARQLEAAKTAANEEVDPAALIVRSYPIYAAYLEPDEVAKLVMRACEPGTWDDEAGTFVQGLGTSLVVKHHVSGHRQVQKLLSQLGILYPSRFDAGRGKPKFGGGPPQVGAGAPPAPPGGGGSPGGFF